MAHIKRMPSHRYPKIIQGTYTHGDRPSGRPAKRWEDCVKADLRSYGVNSLAEASRGQKEMKIFCGTEAITPSWTGVDGLGQDDRHRLGSVLRTQF